ncbi:hypothetical protein ABT354_10895 [Streptomyces sp. NPDC000594]|uniref:hypothetical protein n=1 Tax=Streptomyces sp. NPDC000594 TaxID=3154261 RepID=UPI003327674B
MTLPPLRPRTPAATRGVLGGTPLAGPQGCSGAPGAGPRAGGRKTGGAVAAPLVRKERR